MTLNDLELLQVRILGQFRGISQIREATTAKQYIRIVDDSVVSH